MSYYFLKFISLSIINIKGKLEIKRMRSNVEKTTYAKLKLKDEIKKKNQNFPKR